MSFVIRPPREDEAEVLADLHLRTWAETYAGRFSPSAWDDGARRRRIDMWAGICAARRDPRVAVDRVAVAERDGEAVGLAGAGPNQDDPPPRERQLYFIYLLASAQGTGAGQALLDEVLGDEPASLWVLEDNPRARAFYRRNGFIPDGARQPTGYGAHDEIRLVR